MEIEVIFSKVTTLPHLNFEILILSFFIIVVVIIIIIMKNS